MQSKRLSRFQLDRHKLVVNATEEQHLAIEERLAQRREYGFNQILTELLVVSSKTQPQWKNLIWKPLNENDLAKGSFAILLGEDFASIYPDFRSDEKLTVLMNPSLVSISGLTASMQTSLQKGVECSLVSFARPVSIIDDVSTRIDVLPIYKGPDRIWLEGVFRLRGPSLKIGSSCIAILASKGILRLPLRKLLPQRQLLKLKVASTRSRICLSSTSTSTTLKPSISLRERSKFLTSLCILYACSRGKSSSFPKLLDKWERNMLRVIENESIQ